MRKLRKGEGGANPQFCTEGGGKTGGGIRYLLQCIPRNASKIASEG